MTRASRLLVAVLLSALVACPGADVVREPSLEPDAVRALELYRDALVAGRPADAFALIHPDAREGLDERAFTTLYGRHKDALVAQAEGLLARARAARPVERAEVRTDRGTALLERTPEGWRLVSPVGIAPAPDDSTPGLTPRPTP